jgi:hypothetical protein
LPQVCSYLYWAFGQIFGFCALPMLLSETLQRPDTNLSTFCANYKTRTKELLENQQMTCQLQITLIIVSGWYLR